jgi:hypothetical protein
MFISIFSFAQEERKVLVEVFTNSHCPLCPAAHNVLDNYLAGTNGDKISYIYYHMVYPYSDDQLYLESQEGSDARDNYYNPVQATPQGWFDGTHQGSTSGWAASLNSLITTESPLKIILSGSRNSSQFIINSEISRTGSVNDNDLVIHFVVVEDLYYDGRNTVSNHKHVMRKMLPTPSGQSFSINLNETKDIEQIIDIDPLWDRDSLSIVVFVQSTGSMTVYQSETISYNDLVTTSVDDNELSPSEFILEQNYPNPFNPSTSINYSIPVSSFVTLKIYNVLGKEITTLVNEERPAGSYELNFSAKDLTSGIYFYKLQAGDPESSSGQGFAETKKMILLK